jgi:multidrug efflux system membrane fusion protein
MTRTRIFLLIGLVVLVGGLAFSFRSAFLPQNKQATQERTSARGEQSAPRRGGANTARPSPVTTAPAVVKDFPIRRNTIGTLESPATVLVRARVDSQVLEQHVRDGQLVKKGDLLFTLDDRELKATLARDQATLARDEATLARTEADLRRTQELIARNVAPRQQLDTSIAENKAAAATVEADKAQIDTDNLRLNYTRITAPIVGRVGAIRVTPGNLVSTSDTAGLVTITQLQPIRVSFTLPERDLALLRAASAQNPPAAVQVSASGEAQPLATGMLDFVDSSVDISSGTIAAKATFANTDLTLWPGMYVDVLITLDTRPNITMVPTVAIQMGQKGPFLFVTKPDGTAEMRNLKLAGSLERETAVTSGVAPGERVVVEGQMRLSDGARVSEASSVAADGKPDQAPPAPVANGGAR